MNLELRHLRALVAVAEAQTFTDAAIALGTSQASVSRSVAALERALGVRVFQRTTRSVTPTATGKRIIEHARRVLDEARLLRPGGELVFLVDSVLVMLCSGDVGVAGERLLRPQFGMHRFEWPDDDSVEFHLPHGEMIALLRRSGFDVEELIEVRPPQDAVTRYDLVSLEWSRKWPCEEIWRARKRPASEP